jgi:hypothetical protein
MIKDGVLSTYSIETGQFSDERITSPVGFLLDRFPHYKDQAGDPAAEYESLWQMLRLI